MIALELERWSCFLAFDIQFLLKLGGDIALTTGGRSVRQGGEQRFGVQKMSLGEKIQNTPLVSACAEIAHIL